jgi:hypothetical protein
MAFKDKKAPVREKPDSELVRRFKQSPFLFIGSVVILILVVVTFVGGDLLSGAGGGRDADLTFGYYDKVPISYVPGNYFAQYYDMVSWRYRDSMNNENFAFMGYQIWRETFEAAAIHTAILHEMNKAGYTAPAKVIDREVARLPQFQENGRFSQTLYRQMDENRRLALWRQMQEEYTKNHYLSDVVGLLKSEGEAGFIGRMAAVERSFEMAVFSVDAYPDSEIEAYAREHMDLFRSVHLSMITTGSNEREAQRILSSILNGETTFEDAARTHSKDTYAGRGGDMGNKMIHELIPDIPEANVRDAAIALSRGEYSDVMQAADGWVFFRAEEPVQEADFSDPAVLEKVRSYMRNFQRGRMEDWAIAQAHDFAALVDEHGFEDALLLRRVESRSFGPIPLNYGDVELFTTLASQSVRELGGAAADENFWAAAFTTPVGSLSKPLVQGSNILLLLPTAETEAEELRIEGIASMFNLYWLDYLTEQSLQQYFLNSPKMEDKFFEIYFRYFMGN